MRQTGIAPNLSVRRSAEAVDFYKRAFGAVVLHLVGNETDVVAQLSVDGAEFWIAEESPEHLNFSPESLDGGTARIILTVEDPDAMVERAVAAGATLVVAMEDNYGWRLGRIVDPYGHHWEVGKPLGEWPPPGCD